MATLKVGISHVAAEGEGISEARSSVKKWTGARKVKRRCEVNTVNDG